MPITCKTKSEEPDLVLFVHAQGQLLQTDIDKFSNFFNGHLSGDKPFRVFFDLRKVENANMSVITSLAKYMGEYETKAHGKVLGSSILVYGTIVEGLLKLLFTFKEPTTPYFVTSKLQDACEFLETL